VAQASYLTSGAAQTSDRRFFGGSRASPTQPAPRGRYVAAGLLALAVAIVGGAIAMLTSSASLSTDATALATVGMPLGGGRIQRVSVTTGPNSRNVPVTVRGEQIWPTRLIPARQVLSIDVVVKRPGWISWLAGSTETLHMKMMTPSARLVTHYLTLAPGAPIKLTFRDPIRVISYVQLGHLHRQVLAAPRTEIRLKRTAIAGSLEVSAALRSWETAEPAAVSWFPAGAAASALATPAPGTSLTPTTPIAISFSKPVSSALGSSRPLISPDTRGTWQTVDQHTIVFRPEGYGYGLGATVTIGLPSGVKLIGAQPDGASWSVQPGSTLRLQQLLAQLGYLPLKFNGPHVARNPVAQENAAIKPPAGNFSWGYADVPQALRSFWAPGASGVMTQGALMAFENDHGMLADGVANGNVWRVLINAADAGKRSTFGYTFVMVDKESRPESLTLWHSGRTAMSTPVNTGVAAAATADGTYPVFEHVPVTTMTGRNPDGSQYRDPGIQWVSYFNGGDALHAFARAQYGFPQSDGCVEMPLDSAARLYPFTPIGTLVHVA